ncbi:hypothetical protein Tco_1175641 [Tanacetum coccineum]
MGASGKCKKGLSQKDGASGAMHVKHLSAFQGQVETVITIFEDTAKKIMPSTVKANLDREDEFVLKALAKDIRELRSLTDGKTRMFYEIVVVPIYSEKDLGILQGNSKTLRTICNRG